MPSVLRTGTIFPSRRKQENRRFNGFRPSKLSLLPLFKNWGQPHFGVNGRRVAEYMLMTSLWPYLIMETPDPVADTRFLCDTLDFAYAGHDDYDPLLAVVVPEGGVLELLRAETDEVNRCAVLFGCTNLDEFLKAMTKKGVTVSEVKETILGRLCMVALPSGASLGVCEPYFPSAHAAERMEPRSIDTLLE